MNQHQFILSTEESVTVERVAFSGFVHSCRNLGHVAFFLMQDSFGVIQVVWQKEVLDTKITDLLIGKKICVLGKIRLREQKATSSALVNNTIEIEAEDCFIIDKEKKIYSLLNDAETIHSAFKEKRVEDFISKDKCFELALFHQQLMAKLRHFMQERGFIELSHFQKNEEVEKQDSWQVTEKGFDRNYYFNYKLESIRTINFRMSVSFSVVSAPEAISQANQILDTLLSLHGLEQLGPIDIISAEECVLNYGSLEHDFRYPFSISQSFFGNQQEVASNQFRKQVRYLCVPNMGESIHQIEKIVDFVREQIGLNITYLHLDEESLDSAMNHSFEPSLKKTDSVLFLANYEDPHYSVIALSAIYQYLRNNQIGFQKKLGAKWIAQQKHVQDHVVNRFSFILNGHQVASCLFEDYHHPLLNKGSVFFDLHSLHSLIFDEKNEKKKEIKILKELNPFSPTQRIKLPIFEDELKAEIAINDELEKNEVIALLKTTSIEAQPPMDKIEGISSSLSDFTMSGADGHFLINLLPEKMQSVLNMAEYEIFQFLWSLLGHKHLVESMRDERAKKGLQQICQLGIVVDYKQILFLNLQTIYLVVEILELLGNSQEFAKKLIKTLLSSAPNDFSNLIECLYVWIVQKKLLVDKKLTSTLLRLSKLGFSTPEFFNFFLNHEGNEKKLNEFLAVVRSLHVLIFPNNDVNYTLVAEVFTKRLLAADIDFHFSKSAVYEVIYYLFKPLNMSFSSFKTYLSQIPERTMDITDCEVSLSGNNWNEIEKCYYFNQDRFFLKLYPSKNAASFFAKASAGICTGIDISLFQRKEHFHINLVLPKEQRVVGNVQAYVFKNAQKTALLIRGINPSASYLNQENMGFILNCVLEAVVQIAKGSPIDQVLLCPSLGIWHVESSRKEIIGLLRILYKGLPTVILDSSFLLFHFASQDKQINYAYLLWSRQAKLITQEV